MTAAPPPALSGSTATGWRSARARRSSPRAGGEHRSSVNITGFGARLRRGPPDRARSRGDGLARARDGSARGRGPPPVDLVSPHGTATPFNDAAECRRSSRARRRGARSAVVHPFKAQIGHTLGAAGARDARHGGRHRARRAPGRGGSGPLDPDAPAQAPRADFRGAPRIGLKVAAAFGGANAALVVGRGPAPKGPRRPPSCTRQFTSTASYRSKAGRGTRTPADRLDRADCLFRLTLAAVVEAVTRPLVGAGSSSGPRSPPSRPTRSSRLASRARRPCRRAAPLPLYLAERRRPGNAQSRSGSRARASRWAAGCMRRSRPWARGGPGRERGTPTAWSSSRSTTWVRRAPCPGNVAPGGAVRRPRLRACRRRARGHASAQWCSRRGEPGAVAPCAGPPRVAAAARARYAFRARAVVAAGRVRARGPPPGLTLRQRGPCARNRNDKLAMIASSLRAGNSGNPGQSAPMSLGPQVAPCAPGASVPLADPFP